MLMTYYKGTFSKTTGEDRTMYFVRSKDLPNSFVTQKLKSSKHKRTLQEGSETVWDLEKQDWRTFNWYSAKGKVETFDGTEEILNNFKS
tara:strand:- start:1077 stop:1343 length:267 start_codon:yes stop_codon:yes gene_type:complete